MDVLMPQLGETVDKGKVTTWFKKVGDAVKPGDNLFEIETDKVSMEIQATSGGTLAEIRVDAGSEAPVGAVVAVISDGAAAATTAKAGSAPRSAPPEAPSPSPAPPAAASAPAPRPPASRPAGSIKLDPYFEVRTPERDYGPAKVGGNAVTPLARRLAAEAGIDLSRVKGSGPHGRIVAKDVGSAPATRASCRHLSLAASRSSRSRRSTATRPMRKCRSTACAARSRPASCRRSKRSRTSI